MNIFIPILKIDAARREVHGIMAEEAPDKSREIFDYASSKPYVEQWSKEALERSTGAGLPVNLGNVRAQHSSIAAGKLVDVRFDDNKKCIPVIAHIVDDNEWKKVEQGVYTGFSIGGSYVNRWPDGQYTRYTAKPAEVSIVDNPCMYGARFTMVKADGVEEVRQFPQKENSGGNDSMDLTKLEELSKSVAALQKQTETQAEELKKMSAENVAHLHALLIHHAGMGQHLEKMCEAAQKAAGLTDAQKAAAAAELAKANGGNANPNQNANAGAGASAELAEVKKALADQAKVLTDLAALVEKIAKQPANSGAVSGAGAGDGERGKQPGNEGGNGGARFVPNGVTKSDVADESLRKALDNGKPIFPVKN